LSSCCAAWSPRPAPNPATSSTTNTGADSFHFFEIYQDQAALEAHRTTDHYKAYRAAIPNHLAEPIGVKVLAGLDVA